MMMRLLTVLLISSIAGYCAGIVFDGDSADYASSANFPVLNEMTLMTWIKLNSLPSGSATRMYPISNDLSGPTDGWGLFIDNGPDVFQFRANGLSQSTVDGGTVLAADVWYHCAVVHDSTQLRLYIDGQLDGVTNTGGAIAYNGDESFFLSGRSDRLFPFDGRIYGLKLFNRALTKQEIRSDYYTIAQKAGGWITVAAPSSTALVWVLSGPDISTFQTGDSLTNTILGKNQRGNNLEVNGQYRISDMPTK